MPERWMNEMQKIGRMKPIPDLLERAEHGPLLPEPRPRPTSRVAATVLAVVITVAAGWMAYAALSGTRGQQPLGDGSTDFAATWPETSLTEAQQVQARVDSGDPAVQWRTDPAAVALRFGGAVLGWPNPLAGETTTNDPDTIIVSLNGPDASCQGQACSVPSPQSVVTLTLQRLVRSGDGGIWSVTAVNGAESV